MTQFGHFSAKVHSILDPNSVVYLPSLSQTELLNVDLFFCVLIGYLGGQHGPILSVRDFPSLGPGSAVGKKGKNGVKHRRAKRVQRWTWEGKPPFSLPLRVRCWPIFVLFFLHCEPGLRLGFPALVPQKQDLFLAI